MPRQGVLCTACGVFARRRVSVTRQCTHVAFIVIVYYVSYIDLAMVPTFSTAAPAPPTLWTRSDSHNIDHWVPITPMGVRNYVRSGDDC